MNECDFGNNCNHLLSYVLYDQGAGHNMLIIFAYLCVQ
jgi:hypothetical protein